MDYFSIEELGESISQGLPDWQKEVNTKWLGQIHKTLREGGTWIFPDQQRIFFKEKDGFKEVLMSDE